MANGRKYFYGNGVQTAGLATGGQVGPPGVNQASVEAWTQSVTVPVAGSGSSGWTMNTARYPGGAGTATAAIAFAGQPITAATELYNGSTWTSVNSMNTARFKIGGAGSQTAALGFSGYTGPPAVTGNTNATEKWNGTTWTNNPTGLNTTRYALGGAGTQTAALAFGGAQPASSNTPQNATESFNGSTWTSLNNMNTARYGLTGAGSQTSVVAFGGYNTPYSAATESWNGSTWTSVNSMSTARVQLGGAGTSSTSALGFGGDAGGSNSSATELWNGTIWTNLPSMTTARQGVGGAGTQTSGLAFGGYTSGFVGTTEVWTGILAGPYNIKTLNTK
jgi:hypothetical protein